MRPLLFRVISCTVASFPLCLFFFVFTPIFVIVLLLYLRGVSALYQCGYEFRWDTCFQKCPCAATTFFCVMVNLVAFMKQRYREQNFVPKFVATDPERFLTFRKITSLRNKWDMAMTWCNHARFVTDCLISISHRCKTYPNRSSTTLRPPLFQHGRIHSCMVWVTFSSGRTYVYMQSPVVSLSNCRTGSP